MMGIKKSNRLEMPQIIIFFFNSLKSMRESSLEDHTMNDFLILLPFLVRGQLSLAAYEALLASLV